MKGVFTIVFLLPAFFTASAQSPSRNYANNDAHNSKTSSRGKISLNGQWRGSFNEATPGILGRITDSRTTYVLELDVQGSKVGGYSYTYFTDLGAKRYYTICRVTGSFDSRTGKMVVTEVERIKYNTPPNIQNCFQIHTLHYERGSDNTEYLKGEWVPAPDQVCTGKGSTILSRQVLNRQPFVARPPAKKENQIAKAPVKKTPVPATPKPAEKPKEQVTAQTEKVPVPEKTKPISDQIKVEKPSEEVAKPNRKIEMPPVPSFRGYDSRKNEVVQTIKVNNPVFQIELYDNGEIDGDSVSVFFNGKLILSHQRLSDKPIKATLSIDPQYRQNVVTMYAENLGSIPPNTALMIVRDGSRRYEVRLESDLGKSGTVIFRHDED
ncbi:MAG TPA: hypothetical protein PLM81_08595 [Ginsengibacter sp.]|nr:hypothetical protein [Ginsengibacter sp.]HRP45198.1 hypothetical protein [Ginsengibacter sp.]